MDKKQSNMMLKKQCMYIPVNHAMGTEVTEEVIGVTVGPACSGKEELKKVK